MKATQSTMHRVELSAADLLAIVTSALPTFQASAAQWGDARHGGGGTSARVSFEITPAMLQHALAASVPGLPAAFHFQVVAGNPNIAAVISWSA